MCCCKRSRTARSSIRMGWYHMVSEASAERFVFPARAFVKLVKRSSAPFVCSQRHSRLPCSLSLLLCAILMLVKESASLFRPQLCCSAALLSPVAVVCIAEAGEECSAPLLPSALLTTLRCCHPHRATSNSFVFANSCRHRCI